MLELIPVHTDYELQCGKRLEIKILPKSGNPKGPVELTITAENVDMKTYESAVKSVDYKVVVVPVHRLEVVTENTDLKAEDPAVMFGVGAYDAAGNELDTLDGVQLAWFIGKISLGRTTGSSQYRIIQEPGERSPCSRALRQDQSST